MRVGTNKLPVQNSAPHIKNASIYSRFECADKASHPPSTEKGDKQAIDVVYVHLSDLNASCVEVDVLPDNAGPWHRLSTHLSYADGVVYLLGGGPKRMAAKATANRA